LIVLIKSILHISIASPGGAYLHIGLAFLLDDIISSDKN